MDNLTQEIIAIDFKLMDRKPAGEPRNLRRLYAPGSEPMPLDDEGGHINAEIIE